MPAVSLAPLGNLTTDELVAETRIKLGDLNPNGRWTNPSLLANIDRAHKRAVRLLLYPDARVILPTVSGVQLYRWPLMLRTDAIYIAGQPIVPSDLATLEGRQINQYDESGDGSQIPSPYGDAPAGTVTQGGGVAAPAWAIQSPLSYPDLNGQWVRPAPDAQPWSQSQRPRYYWRGGWLGFDPPPANSNLAIQVDGVVMPDTITSLGQQLPTPDNFLDLITWMAVSLCKFPDDSDRSEKMKKEADGEATSELRQLRMWLKDYRGPVRDGPKVNTMRPAYNWYHKRTSRTRGGWR